MNLIIMLLFVFLVVPGSLIVHELGHLVGAKLKKATTIRLVIGSGLPMFQFTLFNVEVVVNFMLIFGSYTSTVRETPFQDNEKIFITVLGPVFNGLLAIIFLISYVIFNPDPLFYLIILFNLWLAIVNVIPYKLGMKQSDGYIVYKILQNKFTKQK